MSNKESIKVISKNRKAYHNYFILENFEVGIELKGTEVKSIRKGNISLKDSWCSIIDEEIFVNGMHIALYEQGNIFNVDSLRVRKLLMHKKEISKLFGQTKQKGYSIIPILVYFKSSKVKLQIALCKGKKIYDKREDLAKKSAQRDIERAFKQNQKY